MIARKTLLAVSNSMLGAGLGLAWLWAAGRWMGIRAFGEFGYALALAGLAGIIGTLALPTAHVYFYSKPGVNRARLNGTILSLLSGLQVAAVLVLIGGYLFWTSVVGRQPIKVTIPTIALCMVVMMADNVRSGIISTFQAFEEAAKNQLALTMEYIGKLGGAVLVSLAFATQLEGYTPPFAGLGRAIAAILPTPYAAGTTHLGAFWLALAFAFGSLLSLTSALLLMLRDRGRHPVSLPSAATAATYLRFAAPLTFVAILSVASAHIDRFTIGLFFDDREVGAYFAPQRLVGVLTIISAGLATYLFPHLRRRRSSGDEKGALATLLAATRWTLIATAPIAAFLVFFPREMLHLVSDQFADNSVAVMRILVAWGVILALNGLLNASLQAHGRPGVISAISSLVFFLNIALNLVFVPREVLGVRLLGLGAEGAALATVIAFLVGYTANQFYAARRYQHPAVPWHAITAIVAALVAAGLTKVALAFVYPELDRFYEVGAAAGVVAIVYAALLVAAGELTKDDYAMARRTLSPRGFASDVVSEFRRERGGGGP